MKIIVLALMAALFHGGARSGEAQQQPAGTQQVVGCDIFAARGSLNCDVMGDLCPVECSGGGNSTGRGSGGGAPAPATISCSVVALNEACSPVMSTLCPDACDAARVSAPPAPPTSGPIATTCAVLIELDGGCSHDLSVHDPAMLTGTRVSDMCPEQCSGLGGCAPTAADVSFLEVARDRSGHGARVELGGDACVDGGGVAFSGQGWVELDVGSEYISSGACTVSWWLLKGAANVWDRTEGIAGRREVLFSHPAAEFGGEFLEISVAREAWHDHFTLEVRLAAAAAWSFPFSAHRDEVPMWVHLSVVVDGNSARLYRDGAEISGERGQVIQGAYIGCYADRSSPDRDLAGTIDPGSLTSGATITFGCAAVWSADFGNPIADVQATATQSLCSAICSGSGYRYMGLQWHDQCWCDNSFGSHGLATGCGDGGRNCGAGLDTCGNKNAVFDLQTTFLHETEFIAELATFRGAGLAGTAIVGAAQFHLSGLRGTVAMFQLYPNALPPGRATCVYEGGRQLVVSGRLALLADTTCREAVSTGCTSQAATGPEFGHPITSAAVDDSSCTFEQPAGATTPRAGTVRVTDEWQTVSLPGSYATPLVFCNLLSSSSTAQVRGRHSLS